MTAQQMVQLICTTILMITVVLVGIFGTDITARWLKNKREERMNSVKAAEARQSERFDKERNSWLQILAEKDKQISTLNAMVARLEKGNDIANRILKNAEIRRESV